MVPSTPLDCVSFQSGNVISQQKYLWGFGKVKDFKILLDTKVVVSKKLSTFVLVNWKRGKIVGRPEGKLLLLLLIVKNGIVVRLCRRIILQHRTKNCSGSPATRCRTNKTMYMCFVKIKADDIDKAEDDAAADESHRIRIVKYRFC
jgi:hypothetical protein